MEKGGFVYIMTNPKNTVLYTGVSSRLKERIREHKTKHYQTSFTAKYKISKLIYFEEHNDIREAIEREKQIKAGSRAKKIGLIETVNPDWNDLFHLL
ncbi:MAG: GIY-YIG nuclease family protein [Bacteroidales bacterium]|jgi:putative endonuclease